MRKAAIGILLVMVIVSSALAFWQIARTGQTERIVESTPAPTAAPTAAPKPIGPVKRTQAIVSPLPLRQGRYIVVDLSQQRLYAMKDGKGLMPAIKVSTGAGSHATPTGEWPIYQKDLGRRWSKSYGGWMWNLLRFNKKIYVHGTAESNYHLLGQPASHGCVRVHQSDSLRLFDEFEVGDRVIVQA